MKNHLLLLTGREKEVLQMLATGLTYAGIGQRLGISAETVKKHLSHIYQKLDVKNKVEALIKAKAI